MSFPALRRRLHLILYRYHVWTLDAKLAALKWGYQFTEPKEHIADMEARHEELEKLEKGKRRDEVYQSVGHALSAWAQMEESLVHIAGWLLRTTPERAGIVMYSIINFNVWLMLLDELFTIDERYGALKPRFNKIADKLRKLKDTRDRLAHHTNLTDEAREGLDVALQRRKLDLRQKSLKHQPLGFEEIHLFSQALVRVILDLNDLMGDFTAVNLKDVERLEASPEEPPQPDSGQPR